MTIPNRSLSVLRGIALGISAYFIAAHLWALVLIAPQFYRRSDVRPFYTAATMLRSGHGHELYNWDLQKRFEDAAISPEAPERELPFLSPAYYAAMLYPLSLMSYKAAYLSLLAFNLAMLLLCWISLWRWSENLRAIYSWLPLAMLCGFYPASIAFVLGQNSILLMAIFIGSFVLLNKHWNFAAGALLALGLFKFQIVLPVAFLFLLWRRWRFVGGFSAVACALTIFSIWLTGIEQARVYAHLLSSVGSFGITTVGLSQQWYWMPNLAGFVSATLGGLISPAAILVTTTALSAIVIGLTAKLGWRTRSAADLMLLAIPSAVLVGYHTFIHDASILLIPIVVLVNSYLPFEGTASHKRWIARAAALMFVACIGASYFHASILAIPIFGFLLVIAATLQSRNYSLPASVDKIAAEQTAVPLREDSECLALPVG